MARRAAVAIETRGLRDLQRDLRRMEPQAAKEVRGELRKGAAVISTAASPLAPRGVSGKLAGGYRPGVTMRGAFVRSRVPYAGVHEYGGTISPKGTPITIRESAPVRKAIDAKAGAIVRQVADGLEALALRHGWR